MATADCGHEYGPPGPEGGAAGYGVDDSGKTWCYACCNERERADMQKAERWTAYLVKEEGGYVLTTWPGGALATVISKAVRRVGFGWKPSRWYFRATAWDGSKWYGNSPGPGMYARMHRCKGKSMKTCRVQERQRWVDTEPPPASLADILGFLLLLGGIALAFGAAIVTQGG